MEILRIPCECDNGFRKCIFCDGSGSAWELNGKRYYWNVPGGRRITCPDCKGHGKKRCSNCEGLGYHAIRMPLSTSTASTNQVTVSREECNICDGRGWATCPSCNGTKYVLFLAGILQVQPNHMKGIQLPAQHAKGLLRFTVQSAMVLAI